METKMYYSYVMGIDDSILELKNQGFVIENDNENYTVSFPENKANIWEAFITKKLELGYWNEYLADDKVVFLFQMEDGIKRYEVYDFKNDEVLALCEKLCECKMESHEKMLSENHYYKKVMADRIKRANQTYWNEHADLWFGTTALPTLGVLFPTEEELHLFGDVAGKRMLEICCGSGHSLKYNAKRGAAELWGVDISQKQLENASAYLKENGYSANLICSPMEADMDIPKEYFDIVYSIYGIGWTTDLQGTIDKIASYSDAADAISSYSEDDILCDFEDCTPAYYDEYYFELEKAENASADGKKHKSKKYKNQEVFDQIVELLELPQ